jgi:hypothetical protein
MVISQKASEKNVGYRGSKSDSKLKSVKEQRVDGNWCVILTHLRYTLLDFERNSQIKIPSNQIQQRRLYYIIILLYYFTIAGYTLYLSAIDTGSGAELLYVPYSLLIIPAVTYSNADILKKKISDENNSKCGVYLWKNKENGKCYIGSSNSLSRRFREYFNLNYLERNKSMLICRALLKYGYSGFSLEILEYCKLSERL